MPIELDSEYGNALLVLEVPDVLTDPPVQTVYADYGFANTLADSVSTAVASLTRSTTKTIAHADGTLESFGINLPAYDNSMLVVEREVTDYVRYGRSFDIAGGNGWEIRYADITTGQADIYGSTSAVKFEANRSDAVVDLYNQAVVSGGSAVGYVELFARSNSGWIDIGVFDTIAGTNGRRVYLDITNHVVGTQVVTGSGIAFATFEFVDLTTGFTRVRFKCINTLVPSQANLWFDIYTADSDGVPGTSTQSSYFIVNELGFRDIDAYSIVPSIGDAQITLGADVVTVPATGFPTTEYAVLTTFKANQLTNDVETCYVYFTGDGAIGATTNEVSVSYTNGVWTLTVKVDGVTSTATVALAAVKGTIYTVYFKVASLGISLEVNGNVGTGAGAIPSYAHTEISLGYNIAAVKYSRLKVLHTTLLTATQAASAT